eukprot:COSAG03_NODE_14707_length_455_cov_0.424157_1_plen_77_part_10
MATGTGKGIRRSLYRTMTVALASFTTRQQRRYVVLELCAMLGVIRTRQRAVQSMRQVGTCNGEGSKQPRCLIVALVL